MTETEEERTTQIRLVELPKYPSESRGLCVVYPSTDPKSFCCLFPFFSFLKSRSPFPTCESKQVDTTSGPTPSTIGDPSTSTFLLMSHRFNHGGLFIGCTTLRRSHHGYGRPHLSFSSLSPLSGLSSLEDQLQTSCPSSIGPVLFLLVKSVDLVHLCPSYPGTSG